MTSWDVAVKLARESTRNILKHFKADTRGAQRLGPARPEVCKGHTGKKKVCDTIFMYVASSEKRRRALPRPALAATRVASPCFHFRRVPNDKQETKGRATRNDEKKKKNTTPPFHITKCPLRTNFARHYRAVRALEAHRKNNEQR